MYLCGLYLISRQLPVAPPCLYLVNILGKVLGPGHQLRAALLLTYLLKCWVRTTVGVQFMMGMNVCSCWSRTGVLATAQPSRQCRSRTFTTMQVMCAFKQCFSDFRNVLYEMFSKRIKLNPYLCYSFIFFLSRKQITNWTSGFRYYYFKIALNIISFSTSVFCFLKY